MTWYLLSNSCLRLGLFCLPLFGLPLLYIRNSFLGYLFRLNFLLFFPFFSFSLFFHFFISIFPSISVSMYLGCRRADVCCACRIQYDGIVVLRCILLYSITMNCCSICHSCVTRVLYIYTWRIITDTRWGVLDVDGYKENTHLIPDIQGLWSQTTTR